MIWIKQKSCKGWADAGYQHVLCHELSKRLIKRCRGHRGRFVTLTYRREEYEDAEDLYRRQREERHIRRFIARLSKYLDESLTGRWLCKLEFQKGGWVHWHVILLDVNWIDQVDLTNVWGHGYVWIKPLNATNIRYTCKYISKDGSLPTYILHEPIRSLKIVRVSPGFWGEPSKTSEKNERPRMKITGVYIPIGQMIDKAATQTIAHDGEGIFSSIPMDMMTVILCATHMRCKIITAYNGWIGIGGLGWHGVRELQEAAAGCGPPPTGGPAPACRLHLNKGGNPPPTYPRWLVEYIKDQCKHQEYVCSQ